MIEMGRIIFLSAMAFVAFRYISRSNKRHEGIGAGTGGTEVLAPPVSPKLVVASAVPVPAVKSPEKPSVAAEPNPSR